MSSSLFSFFSELGEKGTIRCQKSFKVSNKRNTGQLKRKRSHKKTKRRTRKKRRKRKNHSFLSDKSLGSAIAIKTSRDGQQVYIQLDIYIHLYLCIDVYSLPPGFPTIPPRLSLYSRFSILFFAKIDERFFL